MFNIAIFGEFQHELSAQTSRKLVEFVKNTISGNIVFVCNANGIFKRARNVSSQVEMLFDNGINYILAGEQAMTRNAGRKELLSNKGSIAGPMNSADNAFKFNPIEVIVEGKKIEFISLIQSNGRTPADDEIEILDRLFTKKRDVDLSIINLNGTDLDLKEAIAHKYNMQINKICFIGNGTGKLTIGEELNNNIFIADCGSTKSPQTIQGLTHSSWWDKCVNREHNLETLHDSNLIADLSIIKYDVSDKISLVKQVKIII